MFLGLLLLLGVCLAAPAQKFTDCKTKQIDLSGPYSLPVTPLSGSQYCRFQFNVPPGQFAYAHIITYDVKDDGNELFQIYDVDNHNIMISGPGSGAPPSLFSKFNATSAWPQPFIIYFQMDPTTTMKWSADITLQKNMLGQNVKASFTVDTDSVSPVLYYQDLQEGQTYNVNSLQNLVVLRNALGDYSTYSNYYAQNNVFVYDSGTLIGTLLTVGSDFCPLSHTKMLQLYVAKSIQEIPKGAILITDSSNVANAYYYSVSYVPVGTQDHTQQLFLLGSDTSQGIVTIIGEKNGSPFDLRQLTPMNGNTADVTCNNGGPTKGFSGKSYLTPKQLPQHFEGRLNTFYVASGMENMKYTLS